METLSGDGPFTVFAPDNAAFDKLPKATLTDILKPENKQQHTDILTYHVVPGTYAASDLSDGQELKTVNGETLTVSIKDGAVKVGDATVTQADVFPEQRRRARDRHRAAAVTQAGSTERGRRGERRPGSDEGRPSGRPSLRSTPGDLYASAPWTPRCC